MVADSALTPAQARAARGLLHWSQQDLATKAGVAVSTVADFERGQRVPVPNNALAIRQAFEMAGIVFTEGGICHGFQWTFMTEHAMSTLNVTFGLENVAIALDFVSIFGTVDLPKVSIRAVQSATAELKARLSSFVERYGPSTPHLHRLKKAVSDLADGAFFLVLPVPPSSTAEKLQCEQLIHQLNNPEARTHESEQERVFGALLREYDITVPRTDKRVVIGKTRKQDRTCRFCHLTVRDGARFDNQAHAISAALGNRYLKLGDECDDCNGYFGREVEPTLIELLNIQRVFLGIQAGGSRPIVEFSGGKMLHDGERVIVMSDKISEDASGALNAQLGETKRIVPVKFYQALAKFALSVIPEKELPALRRTISWVRNDEFAGRPLPKVAAAVVFLPPNPSAQITLYVRRQATSKLPHVVCEFRVGCYMYVYVLPFSDKDSWDLIEFFEDGSFKDTFRHYAYVPSWNLQDFSATQEVSIIQSIRFSPRGAAAP